MNIVSYFKTQNFIAFQPLLSILEIYVMETFHLACQSLAIAESVGLIKIIALDFSKQDVIH